MYGFSPLFATFARQKEQNNHKKHDMRILYVHGYGSNKDSHTGQMLRTYFSSARSAEIITDTFDLVDGLATIARIRHIATEQSVALVVGSSLGAFHTLALDLPVPKILINPCMMPSLVIDKFMKSPDDSLRRMCEEVERRVYSAVSDYARRQTFAAFSTADEFFSFKDFFDEHYSPSNSLSVPGAKHHLDYSQISLMLDHFLPLIEPQLP